SNKLWEFRQVAQKPEHADLCQKIARDLGLTLTLQYAWHEVKILIKDILDGPRFHQRPIVQRNAHVLSTQSNIQPAPQSKKQRGVHLFIVHKTAVLFLFPLILTLSA